MKKIGIVGSRRRNSKHDFMKVTRALSKVYEEGDILVSGGCPKGADHFAEVLAREKGCSILIHYPDKEKGAGGLFERNGFIADDSDKLIAAVAEDRKGGTEDTIKKFCKKLYAEIKNKKGCIKQREEKAIEDKFLILV